LIYTVVQYFAVQCPYMMQTPFEVLSGPQKKEIGQGGRIGKYEGYRADPWEEVQIREGDWDI